MEKKRLNLLIVILIVILVIVVAVLIKPISNFMIISRLQDKASEYVNSGNFHIKMVSIQEDDTILTTDLYKKDNKEARFIETDNSGEIAKILMFNNGERTDMFTETSGEKTVTLDTGMKLDLKIDNVLETKGFFEKFMACFKVKIKEIDYKDKKCYSVEDFFTSDRMYGVEKNESYIDMETGLELLNNTDGLITEKEYEFDNVDDMIFAEPDIGQYKFIKE